MFALTGGLSEPALDDAGLRRWDRVRCLTNDEFFSPDLPPADDAITAVHLAFGRHVRGPAEIASALPFTRQLLERLEPLPGLRRVIYLSSQSIYGNTEDFRTLDTPIAPELPYAMAKYAGEVLVDAFGRRRPDAETLILRMDAVIQSQNLVPALCRNAVRDRRLVIRGGSQYSSYLDQEDAVRAIAAAVLGEGPFAPVYNVGPDRKRVTLSELAALVADIAAGHSRPITVETVPADLRQGAGMDSAAFQRDFSWQPRRSLRDMVASVYEDALQDHLSKTGGNTP